MNRTQRNSYANIQLRLQKRMEQQFLPSVYRTLRNQISSFTGNVRAGGIQYALNRWQPMDPIMTAVIENIHLKAGLFAARETRKNIMRETAKSAGAAKGLYLAGQSTMQNGYESERSGRLKEGSKLSAPLPDSTNPLEVKRGSLGFNARMTADIKEYFRLHLLEKAVLPISATTRKRIETVLNKATEEGWGVDRILQELEGEDFREMTRRRARSIVRTETVRASNYASMAAANDSEFEQVKVWIAINDPRTRRTHKHGTGVDGEVRDLLAPFSNGLQFPGDPNGSPDEVISCRCTLAYRAKRDERGRLIPKKREGILISLATRLTDIYRRIAAVLSSL